MLFEKRIQREVEQRIRELEDRRWLCERQDRIEERCSRLEQELFSIRMRMGTGREETCNCKAPDVSQISQMPMI